MPKATEKFLARQKDPSVEVRLSAGFERYESADWQGYTRLGVWDEKYLPTRSFEIIMEPEEAEELAKRLIEAAAITRKNRAQR